MFQVRLAVIRRMSRARAVLLTVPEIVMVSTPGKVLSPRKLFAVRAGFPDRRLKCVAIKSIPFLNPTKILPTPTV
jgi:hypothetical protein